MQCNLCSQCLIVQNTTMKPMILQQIGNSDWANTFPLQTENSVAVVQIEINPAMRKILPQALQQKRNV